VSGQFVLTFSDPVAAFGFYGVDIGDFNGQVTLAYTDTKGVSTSLTVPSSTNNSGGSVLYFGFIDTERPFKSLAFGNTTTGTDFFGFDDFTIASLNQVVSVPAPAALALFSFALLGLGMVRLRA
jgi:hypothetical protein